ncbi:MAG: hypothetical protein WAN11_24180, partial [Syntrophobacteraceae bacterium]
SLPGRKLPPFQIGNCLFPIRGFRGWTLVRFIRKHRILDTRFPIRNESSPDGNRANAERQSKVFEGCGDATLELFVAERGRRGRCGKPKRPEYELEQTTLNELDNGREKANEVEVAVELVLRNRGELFRRGEGTATGRGA